MVKVSIVIPVYGTQAYLPACLDSALAQTLGDIEIICIDDASPDRCGQILDEYAARDSRIRAVHLRENRRQGYGRNLGVDMASGEYVYFLDSDDMITPDAMRELYELAKRDSLDGVFFDGQVIYETQELACIHRSELMEREGKYEERVYTGPELMDAFIRQGEWTCYPQRQFWNRAYLMRENIRTPEGIVHEDLSFSFKAILAAKRTRYVHGTYFIRRFREHSVMTSPMTARNFYGYFVSYCDMGRFMRERGLTCEAAEKNRANIYSIMVGLYRSLYATQDLGSCFKTPEGRCLFDFFESAQKAERYYQDLDEEFKNALSPYEHVYIYGAGKVANTMARRLCNNGFPVDCFVVTNTQDNPKILLGRHVIAIDALKAEADGIILVAVAPGLQREIVPMLTRRRLRYILYNSAKVVSFD